MNYVGSILLDNFEKMASTSPSSQIQSAQKGRPSPTKPNEVDIRDNNQKKITPKGIQD